jgi:ParB family chromosome partitioning protein
MHGDNYSGRSEETIHRIPLGEIRISKQNVRHSAPDRDLDELATSIERVGLLQPVLLMGKLGEPPYQLISGQRRLLAHQKLGKKRIKATFVGELSATDAVIRSLVENIHRVDPEYVDTARAVTFLFKEYGRDERKVHKETGLSLQKVREFILVQERATPAMKALLRERKVKPVDVKRALHATQGDSRKAEDLLRLIVELKPTAHQKRRLVRYGEADGTASARTIIDKAMKPHVEESIVISLPESVRSALSEATERLEMEADELAFKVLSDWLRGQGFLP